MNRTIWVVGGMAVLGLGASGCSMQTCADPLSVGPPVTVALVDATGAPAAARGEARYSGQPSRTFDCSASPETTSADFDCVLGVLQLDPLYNRATTIALRFRLADDSFTEWLPVDLTIRSSTDPNANGPGCEGSWYEGNAKPVTIPSEAQLSSE